MDLKDLVFESKEAWPEAVIESPNLKDAMLLQANYASQVSETTAIFSYIYQSYLLGDVDERISKILEEVAIVEMHHHEKLGEMIVKLGGNPIIASDGKWWNGSYPTYVKNVKEMMVLNIKGEQMAINNYKGTIAKIKNPSMKCVLGRIIEDEIVHIGVFDTLLDYVTFWK